MDANQTLEDLHLAVQAAFDFDDDHLYSFFMSGRAWDESLSAEEKRERLGRAHKVGFRCAL